MNGVIGQLCAPTCKTEPEEPPEDGEMNEMTLPSIRRTECRYPDYSGGP